MDNIPYILTEHSLTVVIDGKAQTMRNDHPSWEMAKAALKDEAWDTLGEMFDVPKAVQRYFDNEVGIDIKNGVVYYEGEPVHNMVVDKILDFMRNGLPYKPLVKFAGKLMENPSRRAVDELYSFLEHKNMPITPEGNFLAYKGVTSDFKDCYSNKFDNSVGQTLSMTRNTVCDDANVGCSQGFHAGSYEYAKGYASHGGNLMIVEINPADVVSVPHDCECQKLRTASYKVVGHYETIDAPPLKEGLNDDYYDYEDDYDGVVEAEEADVYDEGYQAGYDAAIDKLKNG